MMTITSRKSPERYFYSISILTHECYHYPAYRQYFHCRSFSFCFFMGRKVRAV